jgi:esterase/lipase|tara:strand:- start:464 stop:1210 length:747 start_codon:yes stop_codon:yes gene_type:complete
MSNFSYFKITKSKKIRYLKNSKKKGTYIVFLHGFMSDLEGKKPRTFLNFSKKNNLGFLALEYSGHGKSSGKFIDGNISKWSKETSVLINKIVRKNKIILIGSSMGAWIAVNQILKFKKQIKGFMGIGSAPDFLENLMWKKFSKKMKKEIIKNGMLNLKHGEYEYPITLKLIKDGKKNKILNKKIHYDLKIVMVHGSKDTSVPVIYSRKMLKIFKSNEKKLVIIKNGNHSLSSPKSLNILKKELCSFIS